MQYKTRIALRLNNNAWMNPAVSKSRTRFALVNNWSIDARHTPSESSQIISQLHQEHTTDKPVLLRECCSPWEIFTYNWRAMLERHGTLVHRHSNTCSFAHCTILVGFDISGDNHQIIIQTNKLSGTYWSLNWNLTVSAQLWDSRKQKSTAKRKRSEIQL